MGPPDAPSGWAAAPRDATHYAGLPMPGVAAELAQPDTVDVAQLGALPQLLAWALPPPKEERGVNVQRNAITLSLQ